MALKEDTVLSETVDGNWYRAPINVVESDSDGPTVFVLAGQHGIEPGGWMTADALRNARIDCGKLVVCSYANSVAINQHSYSDANGVNMNRQWNPRGDCTHPIARKIWNYIEDCDPDVFFDLHTSRGIYKSGDGGVGQCVFPTPAARDIAEETVNWMNGSHMDNYDDELRWKVGNDQHDDDDPKFMDRVGCHYEGCPGFLIETSRRKTALVGRVEMMWRVVTRAMALSGMRVRRS